MLQQQHSIMPVYSHNSSGFETPVQQTTTLPLCRCRVLYIGNAVPTITKDGLQGIQQPLRERYPTAVASGGPEAPDAKGIDAWLSVWSNGILLEYVDGQRCTETAFFSITMLHYCAAVRYVNMMGFAVEGGGEQFIPLDTPFAKISDSTHPPIFAAIFRRQSGFKVLECHAFVCTNDRAANALVRCCFHAYADVIYSKMEPALADGGVTKAIANGDGADQTTPSRSLTPRSELNLSEQETGTPNGGGGGGGDALNGNHPLLDESFWNERAIGAKAWQRQQNGEYDEVSLASNQQQKHASSSSPTRLQRMQQHNKTDDLDEIKPDLHDEKNRNSLVPYIPANTYASASNARRNAKNAAPTEAPWHQHHHHPFGPPSPHHHHHAWRMPPHHHANTMPPFFQLQHPFHRMPPHMPPPFAFDKSQPPMSPPAGMFSPPPPHFYHWQQQQQPQPHQQQFGGGFPPPPPHHHPGRHQHHPMGGNHRFMPPPYFPGRFMPPPAAAAAAGMYRRQSRPPGMPPQQPFWMPMSPPFGWRSKSSPPPPTTGPIITDYDTYPRRSPTTGAGAMNYEEPIYMRPPMASYNPVSYTHEQYERYYDTYNSMRQQREAGAGGGGGGQRGGGGGGGDAPDPNRVTRPNTPPADYEDVRDAAKTVIVKPQQTSAATNDRVVTTTAHL